MTINEMFNMAKGQTLTQDGCEADVDDKRYNIGDISQKTGLQKTANGWVKPKNGKAPGAKTGPGESPKNVYGAEVDKIYERQLKRIKELRAKGFTDEQIDNDKIIKQTKEDMKNVGKKSESKSDSSEQHDKIGGEIKGNLEAAKYYFDKAQSFSPTDPSYKTYMTKAKQYNDKAKSQADDNGFDFEEMHNSGITQAVNNYAEKQSKPAGSKPAEAPKFKSRNTIMMEKNGFKEVEKGGAFPKLHRFQYKSLSGRNYNVYRDIDGDGFIYHVQTPGGFTKKMRNVKEIVRYLDSDGGNWGDFSHRTRGELIPGSVGREAKARVLKNAPAEKRALYETSNDCAPRVLTKDTKIRVRKA